MNRGGTTIYRGLASLGSPATWRACKPGSTSSSLFPSFTPENTNEGDDQPLHPSAKSATTSSPHPDDERERDGGRAFSARSNMMCKPKNLGDKQRALSLGANPQLSGSMTFGSWRRTVGDCNAVDESQLFARQATLRNLHLAPASVRPPLPPPLVRLSFSQLCPVSLNTPPQLKLVVAFIFLHFVELGGGF
ncbi:hypothetical protein NLG97_g4949 [Lecanicillium saksenae]|uniref:Uncharacterized protein n=1 Tax=Lecanicillium saksenae TaxID=468837 RepID=A0ACC1QVQ1_9HYPO|nr:hypothetical protein NLG97_g4949 [Lecanicillium saksenae]